MFVVASRVARRRITVLNVAVLHEFRQWSVKQIAIELELSLSQVYAALAYYHDHQQEIEQSIREGDRLAKEIGRPLRSFLEQQAGKTGTRWPLPQLLHRNLPITRRARPPSVGYHCNGGDRRGGDRGVGGAGESRRGLASGASSATKRRGGHCELRTCSEASCPTADLN
jgi:uncharacterized protein (DUF433 family)